jgi:hypothetical protein
MGRTTEFAGPPELFPAGEATFLAPFKIGGPSAFTRPPRSRMTITVSFMR